MTWISRVLIDAVDGLVLEVHGQEFAPVLHDEVAKYSYLRDYQFMRDIAAAKYRQAMVGYSAMDLGAWLRLSDSDAIGSVDSTRNLSMAQMNFLAESIVNKTAGVDIVPTRVIDTILAKISLAFAMHFALADLYHHARGSYARMVVDGLLTDQQAVAAWISSMRQVLIFSAAYQRGWLSSFDQSDAKGVGAFQLPAAAAALIAVALIIVATLIYFIDSDRRRQTLRHDVCARAVKDKLPGYEACLETGTLFGGSFRNPLEKGAEAAGQWLGLGLFAALIGAIAIPGILAAVENRQTQRSIRDSAASPAKVDPINVKPGAIQRFRS